MCRSDPSDKHEPLRDLTDIENDIMQLEKETEGLLKEIVD